MDAHPPPIQCRDYGAAIKELRAEEQPLNIPRERYSQLFEASRKKATELGYRTGNLGFRLVKRDEIYIAYFYPVATKDFAPLGGDMIIVLDASGKVFCVHRGA